MDERKAGRVKGRWKWKGKGRKGKRKKGKSVPLQTRHGFGVASGPGFGVAAGLAAALEAADPGFVPMFPSPPPPVVEDEGERAAPPFVEETREVVEAEGLTALGERESGSVRARKGSVLLGG